LDFLLLPFILKWDIGKTNPSFKQTQKQT